MLSTNKLPSQLKVVYFLTLPIHFAANYFAIVFSGKDHPNFAWAYITQKVRCFKKIVMGTPVNDVYDFDFHDYLPL